MESEKKNEEEDHLCNENEEDLEADIDKFYRSMPLTEDTTCGFWFIKSSMLQKFANKSAVVIIYGLSGCLFSASFSYFNGTISTMEKRFKISGESMGIIMVGNDIARLLSTMLFNYYLSRGHRPRWVAFSLYCVAAYCFLNTTPHIFYGSGEDALYLTSEHGYNINNTQVSFENKTQNLCTSEEKTEIQLKEGSIVPQIIFFSTQFLSGLGSAIFHGLGFSYLDDNIKKSKSPAFIGFSHFMRMLGPAIGYGLVSYSLKMYISPELTPTINNRDPRWIGAWWLGWYILGGLLLIFATLMAMFPKTLPKIAARKEYLLLKKKIKPDIDEKLSLKNMLIAMKRLFTNQVYTYNLIASTSYIFAYLPFWVYLPKYIEIQFRQSASTASFATGSIGLVFSALGILIAGLFIQRYRPGARFMACWNMIIDFISSVGIVSYIFLGCKAADEQLPIFSDGSFNATLGCNANCNCDYVKFSPVCSIINNKTFISPCHAGCINEIISENGPKMYSNCSCIENSSIVLKNITENLGNAIIGGSVISGPCPVDCNFVFYIFLSIACVLKFLGALSRITNFLVSIRCVEERDKAFSIGIAMTVFTIFALIPSPIFFGYMIDSACLIWGKTRGRKGNCWIFNPPLMRKRIIVPSSLFLVLGIIFDIGIWCKIGDINMYDDNFEDKKKSEKEEDKKINDK